MNLTEMKASILADGVIDADEVVSLREAIYADGIVDAEEINFLVALRNEAKEVCAEFEAFFFEAAEKNLLADGVIDEDETVWLREVIFADGKVDDNEKAFLRRLKDGAKSYVPSFEQLLADCNL